MVEKLQFCKLSGEYNPHKVGADSHQLDKSNLAAYRLKLPLLQGH